MSLAILFFKAARLWLAKESDQYAAALAYFVPFALAPLLLISMTLVGLLVGRDRLIALLTEWGFVIDPELPRIMTEALLQLESQSDAYVLPIFAIAFFSIMVVVALNSLTAGIHKLWSVDRSGLRAMLLRYGKALLTIILIQVYLVSLIMVSAILTVLDGVSPIINSTFLQPVLFLVSTIVCITLLYRVLPLATLPWRSCFYGGVVAGVLFLGLRAFVTAHVITAPAVTLYGAASIVIILLIWFYAIGSIIFYGAAFAKVHHDNRLR